MKQLFFIFTLIISTFAFGQVPYAFEYPVEKNVNWRFKNNDTVTFHQLTIENKGRWLPNGQIDYIAGLGPYTWPTSITAGTKIWSIDGTTKVISFLDYTGIGLGDGSFLGLDDTPDDYTDHANTLTYVTGDEDSLIFTDGLQWNISGLDSSLLITSDDLNSGFAHISNDFSNYATFNYRNIGLTDGSAALNIYPNRIEPPNIRWYGGESYLNWSLGGTIDAEDGPVNWYFHPFLGGAGAILADSLGDGNLRLMSPADLFTEVDGSITNEGSLTVAAGTGSTSLIQSNTSGSTDVTITAAGINTISEAGNIITITATEVDGSTSNELQNLSYNSGTHAVDIGSGTSAVIPLSDNSTTGLLTSADHTLYSSKGFVITISGTQGTVNDATTYYSGVVTSGSGSTADINRVYIPVNCTLTHASIFMLNAGTIATSETSTFYIRQNNSTDVTVTSSVLLDAQKSAYNVTGLSQSYSAGDYLEGKFTTATFATNPSNIRWTVTLFFVQN